MTISRTSLFSLIRPSILFTVVMVLITGLAYPLLTAGVGNLLFPHQAQGSLITLNGKVVGSELIGQNFTRPEYFQPRPSATSGTDSNGKTVPQPYNAANSSGSNSAPTKADFIKGASDAAAAYRKTNGLANDAPVPVDAVTASGSGLDPDISLANASLQAARVAQARKIPVEQVQDLIRKNTRSRDLGILGEPRINVLQLNLALDALKPS